MSRHSATTRQGAAVWGCALLIEQVGKLVLLVEIIVIAPLNLGDVIDCLIILLVVRELEHRKSQRVNMQWVECDKQAWLTLWNDTGCCCPRTSGW
jgi:hypothetical protein